VIESGSLDAKEVQEEGISLSIIGFTWCYAIINIFGNRASHSRVNDRPVSIFQFSETEEEGQ